MTLSLISTFDTTDRKLPHDLQRRDAFQRCFRPQACLGGKIRLPTRESPGT